MPNTKPCFFHGSHGPLSADIDTRFWHGASPLYPQHLSITAALSEPCVVLHRKMALMKESLCSTLARRTTWIMARSTRGTAWGNGSCQTVSSVYCAVFTGGKTFLMSCQHTASTSSTPPPQPSKSSHAHFITQHVTWGRGESLCSLAAWRAELQKVVFVHLKWLCTLNVISMWRLNPIEEQVQILFLSKSTSTTEQILSITNTNPVFRVLLTGALIGACYAYNSHLFLSCFRWRSFYILDKQLGDPTSPKDQKINLDIGSFFFFT